MFRTIVDTLKEVFWIKPSRKKPKASGRKTAPKSGLKKKKSHTPQKRMAVVLKGKAKPKTEIKSTAKLAVKRIDPSLTQVGEITHYFDRIRVCVVKVTHGTILIGDKLTILGKKTKFVQKVWSMQIESEDVKVAKKGQLIGLKVDKIVAVGDKVYK